MESFLNPRGESSAVDAQSIAPVAVTRAQKMASRLLVLTIVGYPPIGLIASVIYPDASLLAIVFRAAVALYAAFVLLYATLNIPRPLLGKVPLPIAVLLILYSIRLTADYLSGSFPNIQEDALFFFGAAALPTVALCFLSTVWDSLLMTRLLFLVGGVFCAALLFVDATGIDTAFHPMEEFYGRLSVTRLNPISIGHAAATTVLAAIAVYFEPGHSKQLKSFTLPVACVALVCLALAASRGPAVSLAAAIIALLIVQRRWKLLGLVAAATMSWAIYVTRDQSALLNRLLLIGSDQSSVERLELQSLALEQFLGSPVTGSAYVEMISGAYPHNIILESAMAMGAVGLALMVWVSSTSISAAIKRLRLGQIALPLLLIQYLVATQFSGFLATSAEIWVIVAFMLAVGGARRSGPAYEPQATPSQAGLAPR